MATTDPQSAAPARAATTPERALAERMARELGVHVDRAEAAVRNLIARGLIELAPVVSGAALAQAGRQ